MVGRGLEGRTRSIRLVPSALRGPLFCLCRACVQSWALGSGGTAARHCALSRLTRPPRPLSLSLPFSERLQAFLVNYLDPETNELKYMKQLV